MTTTNTAKKITPQESIQVEEVQKTEIIDLHTGSKNQDSENSEELSPQIEKEFNIDLAREVFNFTSNCLVISLICTVWLLCAIPVMGIVHSKDWALNSIISETIQILGNINSNVNIITFITLTTIAAFFTKRLGSTKSR